VREADHDAVGGRARPRPSCEGEQEKGGCGGMPEEGRRRATQVSWSGTLTCRGRQGQVKSTAAAASRVGGKAWVDRLVVCSTENVIYLI
jgi:hypothetical protein